MLAVRHVIGREIQQRARTSHPPNTPPLTLDQAAEPLETPDRSRTHLSRLFTRRRSAPGSPRAALSKSVRRTHAQRHFVSEFPNGWRRGSGASGCLGPSERRDRFLVSRSIASEKAVNPGPKDGGTLPPIPLRSGTSSNSGGASTSITPENCESARFIADPSTRRSVRSAGRVAERFLCLKADGPVPVPALP